MFLFKQQKPCGLTIRPRFSIDYNEMIQLRMTKSWWNKYPGEMEHMLGKITFFNLNRYQMVYLFSFATWEQHKQL